MAESDRLKEKLNEIEVVLDAPTDPTGDVDDPLSWHLSNITRALEEGGGGGGGALKPEVDALKASVTDLELSKQNKLSFAGAYDESTNKVATENYVNTQIGKMTHWSYQVVDALPSLADGKENILYLVKNSGKVDYTEYIFIPKAAGREARYEMIGTTDIDLSNYVTKNDLKTETDKLSDRIKAYEDAKDTYVSELSGTSNNGVITDITKSDNTITVTSKDLSSEVNAIDGTYLVGIELDSSGAIANYSIRNFTTATTEKNGLMSKEDKAQLDTIAGDYLTSADKTELETALDKKVDKVTGKSLVDDTLIAKLEGIEEGAQVNTIEKIKLNGTEIARANKVADLGALATQSDLDNLKTKVGDAKTDTSAATGLFKSIEDEKDRATAAEETLTTEVDKKLNSADLADEVAKLEIQADKVKVADETLTEKLESIDTSIAVIPDKADTTYVDDELAKKQDTLVSGTNIKTINGMSIIGKGNVELAGGVTQTDLDSLKSELSDSINGKVPLPATGKPDVKSAIVMNEDGTTAFDTFPDTSNFAALDGDNQFTNQSKVTLGTAIQSQLNLIYGVQGMPQIDYNAFGQTLVNYKYNAITTSNSTLNFPSNKTGNIVVDTDLADYQKKSDDTLATTDKTVVGAINENFNSIKGMSGIVAIKQVSALPSTVEKNTMYYVGTASPYTIILVDSNSKQTNLGTTAISLDEFAKKADVYTKTETYTKSEIDTKVDAKVTKPANPTNQSFLMEDSSGNVTVVEKHIYEHVINIGTGFASVGLVIRNSSSAKFASYTEVAKWLVDNGFNYADTNYVAYPAFGGINYSNCAVSLPVSKCYGSGSLIRFEGNKPLLKEISGVTLSGGKLTLPPSFSSGYGGTFAVSDITKFTDNVRVLL